MKNKSVTRYYALALFGLIFLLISSCKKEEDSDKILTDADGNVYTSVTIGTQVWMAENLKTTKLVASLNIGGRLVFCILIENCLFTIKKK